VFRKTSFFRGIPFHSVPFRASEWSLPRNSECLGMSTFFRGITEIVPSLFRGIFSERNSVPNPNHACAAKTTYYKLVVRQRGNHSDDHACAAKTTAGKLSSWETIIKSNTVYVPSSPAGEGLGESQFRRLEKKLSTLPTL
jgi:hypothetical protein